MFPRHYVEVLDSQNRVIDFRLYENEADAYRAYHSLHAEAGGYTWRPAHGERKYCGPDARISMDMIRFDTFHSMPDVSLRNHPVNNYQILLAAREYERRSLESFQHRRAYYIKKYRYFLWSLVPIAVVTVILIWLRRHYFSDPVRHLSLTVHLLGFAIVACLLQRQFGSWTGAIFAAVGAWIVHGLLLSMFISRAPLYGWSW